MIKIFTQGNIACIQAGSDNSFLMITNFIKGSYRIIRKGLKTQLSRSNELHIKDFVNYQSSLIAISKTGIYTIDTINFESSILLKNYSALMTCVEYDSVNDRLLIGATSGLYELQDLNTLSPFRNEDFGNIRVSDMCFSNERMILATRGSGLIIASEDHFITLNKKSGLISNELDRISHDNNTVVVSSKQGISCIEFTSDFKDYSITNFSYSNGLLSNEISSIAFSDQKIFVGSNLGISIIDLPEEKVNYESTLILNEIRIDGKRSEPLGQVELDYSQDRIDVYFNCLSFPQQGKIDFRYKLERLDDAWNYTTERKLSYESIPYGEYQLRIGFREVDNNWSDQEIRIFILKKRPLWQTIWFFLFLVVLASLITYSLVRWRSKRKLHTQKQLVRLHELERMAYQAQMNPHFVFNALNTIQSFISNDRNEDALHYLETFSRLVRASLMHSDLKFVPLEAELKLINDYVEIEKIRFPDEFNFEVQVDQKLLQIQVPPMIIQPFVENAIDHGLLPLQGTGNLLVKCEKNKEDMLEISIEDDGAGFSNSKKKSSDHVSKGIQITRDRLRIYDENSKLEIEDKGTGVWDTCKNHTANCITSFLPNTR